MSLTTSNLRFPNGATHRYAPSFVGRYDMGCVVSVSMPSKSVVNGSRTNYSINIKQKVEVERMDGVVEAVGAFVACGEIVPAVVEADAVAVQQVEI